MQALVYDRYGSADVLQIRRVRAPARGNTRALADRLKPFPVVPDDRRLRPIEDVREVFGAFVEARDADDSSRDPREQIRPEETVFQGPPGGADGDSAELVAALTLVSEAVEGGTGKHAKELRLERGRQVSDLVEEDDPPGCGGTGVAFFRVPARLCLFENPGTGTDVRRGAPGDAEQLGIGEIFRETR